MTMQICEIEIVREISTDLALRDMATSFMDAIDALDCQEVIIDFSGVETITRSFAHEYLARKARSSKVSERNVPINVQKMFMVIENSENKPRFEELRHATIISI